MQFELHSKFKPAGDQPEAIEKLEQGLKNKNDFQTLLGITGSGKTFTMANVIARVQKPTLVIAHNKTLAAQLCNEFREFFPNNAVEYFVSYYDYYQPEAYLPRTDTYIEKEAQINDEIDRLRHASTQALITRKDVVIVASVSCIYSLGSPQEYEQTVLHFRESDPAERSGLLRRLVEMQFTRTNADVLRGQFRSRGDVIEIMPMNEEKIIRTVLKDGAIEKIILLDPVTRNEISREKDAWIFPAKHFVANKDATKRAISSIRAELKERLAELEREGKLLEAERLSQRTRYDLEMIQQVGYCSGIENYSRHFDGRASGEPPHTLIDYFGDDFLTIIDESHVTVPQIRGMFEGDKARKNTLVEHGFRLPSARDNRPLKFDEFLQRIKCTVFTSATPSEFERKSSKQIVEQIIRPTGLLDPEVFVRPITQTDFNAGQVDDLIQELEKRSKKGEHALVTTLTKKMAEDLTEYLSERGVRVKYIHSDVQTLDRIKILSDFRSNEFNVLVGVNLLREGLDLPEVTLVAILDADKEGFLRSEVSLIQTIGRAARNAAGQVILYADEITGSIKRAVGETNRRRAMQIGYNKKHGITPRTIIKAVKNIREMFGVEEEKTAKNILDLELIPEPNKIEKVIKEKETEMKRAAKSLQFELAALLRDEIRELEKMRVKSHES
ncbi:MAG: hypothetical protein ACD_76C00142G0001 [uncultured bacterium]|nr:MAG: hypothetical protein ACD_76C00142G0001 [uncultured bacterium]HBD04953.1 excinuclease ABC subunit B [Candidatus Uhrbacteria bacterium]